MSTAPPLVCVWAHGWAYSLDFFTPLLKHIESTWPEGSSQCRMLGLEQGYFERPAGLYAWDGAQWKHNTSREDLKQAHWLGIGHSLGFCQLMHAGLPLDSLISLHGFSRFCAQTAGQSGTPRRLVERMLKKWADSPETVLKDFLERAEGQSCSAIPPFDPQRLRAHLENMMNLSGGEAVPVALSVISSMDGIVSPALCRDCLSSTMEQDSMSPHSGPLSAPQVYTPWLIPAFEALIHGPHRPTGTDSVKHLL